MSHSSRVFTLSFLLLAGLSTAWADPPGVGRPAPDFSLTSMKGQKVTLSAIVGKGVVALVVLRGYPGYQCPLCNRQVQDYIHHAPAFADAGVRVLFVYPGPAQELPARAREFVTGKKLPAHFDLLLDPDYQFTLGYDLRWNAPKETAYPSTFLIDSKGFVFFARFSKTHAGRTTAAEVLELIRTRKR